MSLMTTTNPTITAAQSALIRRLGRLRAKAFAVDLHIGAAFARASAKGWKEQGFAGIGEACFVLHQELSEIPGTWDAWFEARDLGHALRLAEVVDDGADYSLVEA